MSQPIRRDALGVRHVLGLCDLSAASLNAAWRAAFVARDLRVPMRLLYRGGPASIELPAPVSSFIREAAQRCEVEVEPVVVRGDPATECVALARNGLLVLPTPKGNPLGEWLLGSPAERLIRLVRAPVLVVKNTARGSYRRVFVAVDLLASSDHLLIQGATLSRGTGVAVFHALKLGEERILHEMDAPPQAVRAHRRERVNRASTQMQRLHPGGWGIDDVEAGKPVPIVAFGNPAETILAGETAHEAELIVIGKRRKGLLADFLLGSVTRQVLARSEADVLVVPLPPEVHDAAAPPGATDPADASPA
jgi:nucleotide-binding universal stress UspA family protein